ncbi:MAG: hypothetical protein QW196_07830 [Sulfolobales archaeon]
MFAKPIYSGSNYVPEAVEHMVGQSSSTLLLSILSRLLAWEELTGSASRDGRTVSRLGA